MPVAIVACKTRGIQAHDQARFAQTNLRDQPLKSVSVSAGCTRLAQVVVNDVNTLTRPAK
jgi:hypothetical protein